MKFLRHVGRIKTTKKKVLIAYRTLPNDPYNCLIIPTESLGDSYHNALINLVESPSAQDAYEFADVLVRSSFNDGRIMLAALHTQGYLVKVPTNLVEVVPDMQSSIMLDELNVLLAQQRGIGIEDLAVKDPYNPDKKKEDNTVNTTVVEDTPPTVLSDEDLAKKYRADADALSKEATRLRKLANELQPPKKQTTTKTKKSSTTKRSKPVDTNIQ